MKMLSAWSAEGFSPSEFWAQTTESWNAIMRGREQFHRNQSERNTIHAWQVAMFTRTDRLEPLEKYLNRPKPVKTVAEVFGQWDALAAAGFAIKVTDLN